MNSWSDTWKARSANIGTNSCIFQRLQRSVASLEVALRSSCYDTSFKDGDIVLVIGSGGRARVIPVGNPLAISAFFDM
jgi:hypothetical protein